MRLVGEVKRRLLDILFGKQDRGLQGFFSPDHFTFGSPLWRSQLEAAIQKVAGVRAVETIWIRRRGFFNWRPFIEPSIAVTNQEVIRLENNPDFPDRGTLHLMMEGGA